MNFQPTTYLVNFMCVADGSIVSYRVKTYPIPNSKRIARDPDMNI